MSVLRLREVVSNDALALGSRVWVLPCPLIELLQDVEELDAVLLLELFLLVNVVVREELFHPLLFVLEGQTDWLVPRLSLLKVFGVDLAGRTLLID